MGVPAAGALGREGDVPVTSAFRAAWDFHGVAVFLKSFGIMETVRLAEFKI